MKLLTFVFLFLFSISAYATETVIRDASATAIPAAYTTAGGELMTDVKGQNICCMNHTGFAVLVCFSGKTAATCNDDWYLDDGFGFCFDREPLANSVWVKGYAGAVSTGIFQCRTW